MKEEARTATTQTISPAIIIHFLVNLLTNKQKFTIFAIHSFPITEKTTNRGKKHEKHDEHGLQETRRLVINSIKTDHIV